MFYFTAPLPNCQDDQYVDEHYNATSPDRKYAECVLDYRICYSARIYFSVAMVNAILIIVTTLLFIYCVSGHSICSKSKPPANLDIKQLKKEQKLHSLQKRSVVAITLGAAGHLVFSTCMFLTQTFNDSIGCQLFLYGVIIGFYTWMFAFCIRAHRLRFLFRLNQLKVRYLRMSTAERSVCINEKNYCWYLTNQRNKNYVLTMPYLVYLLSLCIILLITIPAEITSMRKYGVCLVKWGANLLVALYAVFIGVVTPFLLWYLRDNSDAHGIRTEIWIDAIIGIPFFVLYVVWLAVIQPSTKIVFSVNKVYGPSNWVVFFTIVAHTITVVVPLINYISIDNKYWIYARRKVKKFYRKVTKQPPCDTTAPIQLHVQQRHDLESDIAIASPTVILPELSIESLERTLADPEMMNLLQDLAIRDFSCENLLFYEKYLQLEEKFKKELVANRHFEHIRPHSVSVSKSWIQSWSKKSPLIPKITGNDSDNNSTDEDKQNCLSLEQFMSIPIPFKLYPDFMRFYETFIREGSPTQVNISYRARHAIDRVFCNIYKKNPDLNPNAEGESSARPMDSIFCNDEDEEARREQEEAIECSKNNRKPKANSVDDALEQQEPVTLLDFNMFEMARVEVCWNIFNSVYPKLVDMYNNSSNSTTIDSCSNDT